MKVTKVQLIVPATHNRSLRALMNWIVNDKNAVVLDWESETYEDDSFDEEEE